MIADSNVLIKEFSRSNQPILIIGEYTDDFKNDITEGLDIKTENNYLFIPSDGVESLRLITNELNCRPISSRLKFFTVLAVDNMNDEQANTLLKLLEEPPEYLRILLVAGTLSKVLATIKSRAKVYIFNGKQLNESELSLANLLDQPFYLFCQEIAKLEKTDFTNLLLKGIEERKENLLNRDDFRMLKSMSSCLNKVSNSNVSFKLLAEEIYLSQKR